jgi:hypothetical protein
MSWLDSEPKIFLNAKSVFGLRKRMGGGRVRGGGGADGNKDNTGRAVSPWRRWPDPTAIGTAIGGAAVRADREETVTSRSVNPLYKQIVKSIFDRV